MQSKLAWLGLGASLMLNLVFIAGIAFGWSNHLGRGGAGWGGHGGGYGGAHHGKELIERLALTQEQTAGLKALRETMRERREAVWGQGGGRQVMRKAMLAELQKPSFDRAAMAAAIADAFKDRRALFAEMAGELHGYLQTLSPEQRASFFEMAAERGFMRQLFGGRRGGRGHRHK